MKMAENLSYTSKYLSYEDALSHFMSEVDLLNALKDGEVIAYGDYYGNPEEDSYSPRLLINSWCWRTYLFERGVLCGGFGNYGDPSQSDDPVMYKNIFLDLLSIESLKTIKNKKLGRPQEYDWDAFWVEVAYRLFMAGIEEDDFDLPKSLNDWSENAPEDYKVVWNSKKPPSKTALKNKLRPLWKKIGRKVEILSDY